MKKKLTVMLSLLIIVSIALSFTSISSAPATEAETAKKLFLCHLQKFRQEAEIFRGLLSKGVEKDIQKQFLKTRVAYKKAELFLEYWHPFYAGKLNGPPIPYFEESEADMPFQEPSGMQLIESWIFPHINPAEKGNALFQAEEIARYASELQVVNESHAFDDNNIFDAAMEQLYRISSLSITGFDSQLATNSLPECRSALNGLQSLMHIYKKRYEQTVPGSYLKLESKLAGAQQYLLINNDFISFNRMEFIRKYLDPVTIELGKFKKANGFTDNRSGEFYSAVKKEGSLFSPSIFDPYRFLDDYSSSASKIELGRKLFFENGLSSNGQRSCATCHVPAKAFTDGLRTSVAIDGHASLPRNAPTIWNAALQRNLFADSRSRNLEDQVMQVLNNAKEMHGSAQETAEKIITKEIYSGLYQKAFPGAPVEKAAENICNAIASYERTLVALNSRFDNHMRGRNTLTPDEINGFNLFMGKAKCGNCHFMPLFSGAKPPRYYYIESEVLGVPEKANVIPAKLHSDSGRFLVTRSPVHLFSFKTPSVRNAALTAPYMHNGVFNTMEEVIDFYDKGGGKGLNIAPANQSLPFDSLRLSKKEKSDLVLFMKSLTDTSTAY